MSATEGEADRPIHRDLAILGDPTRTRILRLVSREELSVGEIGRVLQVPQSTVSRHLKALDEAGWIHRRSEGTGTRVRAATARMPGPARRLWDVVSEALERDEQSRVDDQRLAALLAARAARRRGGFFADVADRWDVMRRQLYGDDFLLPALVELLPAHWHVLDLGCGQGTTAALLAPVLDRVTAVDREKAMLDAARRRLASCPTVRLLQADLAQLPLADQSVDAALLLLVLHLIAPAEQLFAEVHRLLRPGGLFLVVDLQAHRLRDVARSMGHRHLGFDRDELDRLGRQGGMELIRFTPHPPVAAALGPPLFHALLRRPPS